MENKKVYAMKFSKIYPLLIQKAERKNRSKDEVNEIIYWLTENDVDYETFFGNAPHINPDMALIKGKICGISIESIEEPLMRKIRCLDKMIDELAKGKSMDKILNRQ